MKNPQTIPAILKEIVPLFMPLKSILDKHPEAFVIKYSKEEAGYIIEADLDRLEPLQEKFGE